MYRLFLHSGGRKYALGDIASLEGAATLVNALGQRYMHWKLTKMGFEEVFNIWEGSDVCAVNLQSGESFFLEGTEGDDIWVKETL